MQHLCVNIRRVVACIVLVAFIVTSVPVSYAQNIGVMPVPGSMVALSARTMPPVLKGIKVYPNDPFRFDFLLDKGNSGISPERLRDEAARLVRYFLTTLTIPEKDLWVNLSPYEKDRMVPDTFGLTEMGRDMLAQDYILKQVTASLLYPEGETGKVFWARVYAAARTKYGTTDIPVDTFNKVWIMPDKAVVDEYNGMAFVVEGRLKVMLESDYNAAAKNDEDTSRRGSVPRSLGTGSQEMAKQILREIVIPILEKEVNEGRNFALLRQVYHSLILAAWYKRKIKETLLGKVYVDRQKIAGVDIADKTEKEQIYARYLEAFRKGVYNYIKDEQDPVAQEVIPRKYFSGGEEFTDRAMDPALQVRDVDAAGLTADVDPGALRTVVVDIRPVAGQGSGIVPLSSNHGMAAPLMAGELSDAELERLWASYVNREGLSRYEELLKLFTRDVKEALLDDLALRPVFLQALPSKSMGDVILASDGPHAFRRRIGSSALHDLMQHHSGFLVTDNIKKANALASAQDMALLVGVTDRYSDDTMYPAHRVANGRQVYFPLFDGTWLGVKGAGQFIDRHKAPHYLLADERVARNTRYMGVATERQVQRSLIGTPLLKEAAGEFVEFLGYRRLYDLPDGDGRLVPVKGLKDKDGDDLFPVLIFSRVLHPQRLVKIPQLVKADPGLKRLTGKLSRVLTGLGVLPDGTPLSGGGLMSMILRKRGRAEAIKQNNGVFKVTVHSQDITMGGEEADNEELVTYAEYVKLVEQGIAMQTDDRDLLLTQGLSTAGIRNMVVTLSNMMFKLPEDQARILLPSAFAALQILFKGYFSLLDDRYLKLWASKDTSSDSVRALPTRDWNFKMEYFHPLNNGQENVPQRQDIHRKIVSWARYEVLYREINRKKSAARWAVRMGAPMDGTQHILRSLVEKTAFERTVVTGNDFGEIYTVSDPRSPLHDCVIKMPNPFVGLEKLKQKMQFAKDNMGGMIVPFTVLENVVVNGVLRPMVVVQEKRMVFREFFDVPGKKAGSTDSQMKELIHESVRRGVFLDEWLLPQNMGVEMDTGKLLFVDTMDARTGTMDELFPVQVTGGVAQRKFYLSSREGAYLARLGVLNDEALTALFGTTPGQPVPDITLDLNKGGIDLSMDKLDLQVREGVGGVTFNNDPAMMERLQSAAGFTPVIVAIRSEGLAAFIGVTADAVAGRVSAR